MEKKDTHIVCKINRIFFRDDEIQQSQYKTEWLI